MRQKERTGVAFPVEILFGIAAAFQIDATLFPGRAMRKGHVVICDVVKEVYLLLLKEEAGGNGVDGRVAPALVEEAAVFVEGFEVVEIGWGSQPVEISNLEVRPLPCY